MQYALLPLETSNLLPFLGESYFHPDFFSLEEADLYFKLLQEGLVWQQEPIWIFGKQILQPRLQSTFVKLAFRRVSLRCVPPSHRRMQSVCLICISCKI